MEIWKQLSEFPDCWISNLGRFKEGDTIRNPFINVKSAAVSIKRGKGYVSRSIKVMVSDAFMDRPENAHYLKNKDGDIFNNRVDNLEWVLKKIRKPKSKEVNPNRYLYLTPSGKWAVTISQPGGGMKYCGTYITKESAIEARDRFLETGTTEMVYPLLSDPDYEKILYQILVREGLDKIIPTYEKN